MNAFSRWEQMILLLYPRADARQSKRVTNDKFGRKWGDSRSTGRRAPTVQPWAATECASIVAVERQPDSSMLVSWSDSTRCRYTDQLWVVIVSRISGYCALSGRRIRRGDQVYKPRWKAPYRPANGAEMILVAELEQMVAGIDRWTRSGQTKRVAQTQITG